MSRMLNTLIYAQFSETLQFTYNSLKSRAPPIYLQFFSEPLRFTYKYLAFAFVKLNMYVKGIAIVMSTANNSSCNRIVLVTAKDIPVTNVIKAATTSL